MLEIIDQDRNNCLMLLILMRLANAYYEILFLFYKFAIIILN